MDKEESKISNTEWGLVIGALLMIDLTQMVLEWLLIGLVINPFIDIFVGMSLALYLQLRGQSLANPKRVGGLIGTFFLELIPVVEELPLWCLDGVFNMLLSKSNKILGQIPGGNLATNAISGKKQIPQINSRNRQGSLSNGADRGRVPLQSPRFNLAKNPGQKEPLETEKTPRVSNLLDLRNNAIEKIIPVAPTPNQRFNLNKKEIAQTNQSPLNNIPARVQPRGPISYDEIEQWQLEDTASVTHEYIQNHAKELGVSLSFFPPRGAAVGETYGNRAVYSPDENKILFSKDSEIHPPHIIHEQLHYSSSVKNYRRPFGSIRGGSPQIDPQAFGDKRDYKTGFNSYWNKPEDESSHNFFALNEAVTEKMAREIYQNNRAKIKNDIQTRFPERSSQKSELATRMGRELPKNRMDRGLETEPEKVYEKEIEILDAILEAVARKRVANDNAEFNEALSEEWQNLQRAYFDGNVLYLRRFEKMIGPNLLRKLNDIDPIAEYRDNPEETEKYQEQTRSILAYIKNNQSPSSI